LWGLGSWGCWVWTSNDGKSNECAWPQPSCLNVTLEQEEDVTTFFNAFIHDGLHGLGYGWKWFF
jgi:hypothetical protein